MEHIFDIKRKEYTKFLIDFSADQFKKIEFGRLMGLTIDQISMYAHPDIDQYSMQVIIDCIRAGMDIEKIKIMANPKLKNVGKVTQIKLGFESGLTIDQVLTYASPEHTVKEMIDMRLALSSPNKEVSV